MSADERDREARALGALVLIVAALVVGPLWLGRAPFSHDHPVHLYKAWHFWEHMLLEGRLRGWSSFWFFGYPAEELYPIGPDLWVAAFRAATLGLLSWEATYALALGGFALLSAWAVFALGRRLVGPRAAAVGAVIATLDRGWFREGGWEYTWHFGVWAQPLAMAFALLGLAWLWDAMEQGRGRDLAWAALAVAAALLSHPTAIILLGVGLPVLLGARWVAGRRSGADLGAVGVVVVAGVAVAGFWLVPMLARRAWSTDIGDTWISAGQLLVRLWETGSFFGSGWMGASALAAVGIGLAAWRREAGGLFLAVFGALTLFSATQSALDWLQLERLSDAFEKLQYQRLVLPAKVAVALLAGRGFVGLWEAVATALRQGSRQAAGALGGLTAALAASLLWSVVGFAGFVAGEGWRDLALSGTTAWWPAWERFAAWSADQRAASDDFYRIALVASEHDHSLMAAPVVSDTPIYKVGYTPAKLFNNAPERASDEMFRALSVRYVLSSGELRGNNVRRIADLGGLVLGERTDWSPSRAALVGGGRIAAADFGEEEIRVTLAGVEPGAVLRLNVAVYDRWEATRGGEPVAIRAVEPAPGAGCVVMEVDAADGELVVRYATRAVDAVGAGLSVLGGLGVALLARRERVAWSSVAERRLAWGALALLTLALLAVGARYATAPPRAHPPPGPKATPGPLHGPGVH